MLLANNLSLFGDPTREIGCPCSASVGPILLAFNRRSSKASGRLAQEERLDGMANSEECGEIFYPFQSCFRRAISPSVCAGVVES